MNNLTKKQLYDLWEGVSRVSGWVGLIRRNKLLPEDVLLELEKLDDEVIAISKSEEYYYKEILPEVKKSEREFVEEITKEDPDWVRDRRLEYLKNNLKSLENNNNDFLEIIKKIKNKNEKWFIDLIKDYIRKNDKEMKRIKFEIEAYQKVELDDKDGITDEEIQQAHTVDCSQFVSIKRKSGKHLFALCPFHQEKTPSFCCFEGGKYKCFGCGEIGDAIDLVMKLYNKGFAESVKFLNNKL